MSPLTPEAKLIQNKHLQEAGSGVDRELDSEMSISAPETMEIHTPNLPPDLAEVVTRWPELPDHIKAAIKALVRTQSDERGG